MEDEYKDPSDVAGYKPSVESAPNGRHHPADMEKGRADNLPQYDEQRRKSKYDKGDPFGDETDSEVKYRTMTWWQAAAIMIAETISLGILSLPSVLASIGIVAGVILIAGLGIIATYTGYVIGQFKEAYPHVHNMADAGEVLCEPLGMGAFGREFGGAAQTIFLVFTMGSHILTFTIAMNAITGHATCTIVWGIIGLILLFLLSLPRTMKKVSYLSIVCKLFKPPNSRLATDTPYSFHLHPHRRHDHDDWSRNRTTRPRRSSNTEDRLRISFRERHEHHLRLCGSRRLLQFHQRVEGSEGLSQGSVLFAGLGHDTVHHCGDCGVPLCWARCEVSGFGLDG